MDVKDQRKKMDRIEELERALGNCGLVFTPANVDTWIKERIGGICKNDQFHAEIMVRGAVNCVAHEAAGKIVDLEEQLACHTNQDYVKNLNRELQVLKDQCRALEEEQEDYKFEFKRFGKAKVQDAATISGLVNQVKAAQSYGEEQESIAQDLGQRLTESQNERDDLQGKYDGCYAKYRELEAEVEAAKKV